MLRLWWASFLSPRRSDWLRILFAVAVIGGAAALWGHRTPVAALKLRLRRGNAEIVFRTESGQAPALTIKYLMPRP